MPSYETTLTPEDVADVIAYLLPPLKGRVAVKKLIPRVHLPGAARRRVVLAAQVTADRLLNAGREPQNWLTYSGGYSSQRYSLLRADRRRRTSKNLELKWILQNQVVRRLGVVRRSSSTAIMYLTQRPNDVIALDAKTGRMFWLYRYTPSPDVSSVCCGAQQPRRRHPRRHAVHGHARRASGRDRREERQAAVEHRRSPTTSSATRSRWRRSS